MDLTPIQDKIPIESIHSTFGLVAHPHPYTPFPPSQFLLTPDSTPITTPLRKETKLPTFNSPSPSPTQCDEDDDLLHRTPYPEIINKDTVYKEVYSCNEDPLLFVVPAKLPRTYSQSWEGDNKEATRKIRSELRNPDSFVEATMDNLQDLVSTSTLI